MCLSPLSCTCHPASCLRPTLQIKEVMSRLPQRHQTLLFSATMPREIEALAQAYLTFPITIKVGGFLCLPALPFPTACSLPCGLPLRGMGFMPTIH